MPKHIQIHWSVPGTIYTRHKGNREKFHENTSTKKKYTINKTAIHRTCWPAQHKHSGSDYLTHLLISLFRITMFALLSFSARWSFYALCQCDTCCKDSTATHSEVSFLFQFAVMWNAVIHRLGMLLTLPFTIFACSFHADSSRDFFSLQLYTHQRTGFRDS